MIRHTVTFDRNQNSERRRFLEALLGTATVAGLAGCTGGESPSERPSSVTTEPTTRKRTTRRPQTSTTSQPEATKQVETESHRQTETRQTTCTETSVSRSLGALPVHRTRAMPARAETHGILGEERKAIEATESKVTDGSLPTSYFNLDGSIDGTGTLGMNAGAAFTSYWQAPDDGRYTVTAAYFGTGAYNYAPRDNEKRDYTICLESNLSIIEQCSEVVATKTYPDLRHANEGLRERVAERLLEFLAYRLVAPYLGLVGRFIAKELIGWAIDLDLREPTEGSFFIDPAEPHHLALSFDARAGKTYAIQYTPSIGFVGESKTDWHLMSVVEAKYFLDSLSIRRE